jgi:hypothetical protein
MELAPKRDLIYGLQQLTGKILISNNLQVRILAMNAQNGIALIHPTVTASTMVADLNFERKVRCHIGWLWKK